MECSFAPPQVATPKLMFLPASPLLTAGVPLRAFPRLLALDLEQC